MNAHHGRSPTEPASVPSPPPPRSRRSPRSRWPAARAGRSGGGAASADRHGRPERAGDHHLVDRPDRRRREAAREAGHGVPRPRTPTSRSSLAGRVDHRRPAAEALGRLRRRHATPTSRTPTAAGPASSATAARRWTSPSRWHGTGRRSGRRSRQAARKTATVDGKVIGFPALVDNLGADLQQEAVRRRRRRLPDRRLDLGRLPGRGEEAHRPGQEDLRDGVLGVRQRGHHLAPVAAAVAERRPDPVRRRARRRRSTPTPASTRWTFLRQMAVDDKSHVPRPDRREVRPAVRRRPRSA